MPSGREGHVVTRKGVRPAAEGRRGTRPRGKPVNRADHGPGLARGKAERCSVEVAMNMEGTLPGFEMTPSCIHEPNEYAATRGGISSHDPV